MLCEATETCEHCGAALIDDDEESWPYCPEGCA